MSAHEKGHGGVGADERRKPLDKNNNKKQKKKKQIKQKKLRENGRRHVEVERTSGGWRGERGEEWGGGTDLTNV